MSDPDLGDALAREFTLARDYGDRESYIEAEEHTAYASPASSAPWWQSAYLGGPPVGPSSLPRPLYFPGNPSGKPASVDGADVLAMKRALWRGGRWEGPASKFDDTFSRGFALGVGGNVIDTGVAGFQRQMGIQATGQIGDETYQAMRYARVPVELPHAGEPLFDATAVELLDEPLPADGSIVDVRAALADYCRRSIANEPKIHYRQERPIQSFGVPPETGFTTDCSGHATSAYYWARKETGIAVPDPNGRAFDGYGYTGTLLNNPSVYEPYEVGDLAIYGPSFDASSHVVTCLQRGDQKGALWCSHGSEGAPCTVSLWYRGDLLDVVRPRLVP